MHEKITLPSGVRIVVEPIEHVRSAAVGLWVASGSRHEPADQCGISHFIEHMVFKGSNTRNAAQIAELMDGIGGQVNAFTTKECTSFYARALDSHLDLALDVLCDIFFSPKMDRADIILERGVILEEIGMYEDTPEDLVTERLFSAIYKGHALGRPILGTPATLRTITSARLRDHMKNHYTPDNIVVAMSGSFSQKDVDYLCARFSELEGVSPHQKDPAGYTPAFVCRKKPIEQNHLCLAFPSVSFRDPERYALQLINSILGAGMSSRLFQRVREEQGLCYSIYTFSAAHEDTGILGVYTALGSETERGALALIREEIERFAQDGPTSEELNRAREQLKANVLMGMESTATRMNHLARGELLLGEIISPDEIIARYDAVTLDQVRSLAGRTLDPAGLSFSAVGQVQSAAYYRKILLD